MLPVQVVQGLRRVRSAVYVQCPAFSEAEHRLGIVVSGRWNSTTIQPSRGLGGLFCADDKKRFVFVGGKGGVGKTTTAAAIALRFARSGRKTLVVSTDPAHSLGDALDMPLFAQPCAVPLTEISGEDLKENLYGLEINPAEVVDDFRQALKLDHLRDLLRKRQGGLGAGFLHALAQAGVDLEAFANLLELSPPGIDELVALGHMVQILSDERYSDFQRVVIDTAPTGHTLHLLSFPQFLHGLIGTLLSLNEKVADFSPFSKLLGHIIGSDLHQQLSVTQANLERLMGAMASLSSIFADVNTTSFIVVSIPTHLAVAESKRLLAALEQGNMPARHIIMNQCPFLAADGQHTNSDEVMSTARKVEESTHEALGITSAEASSLRRVMERLHRQHHDAKQQVDILRKEVSDRATVVCMPVFDEEIIGPIALTRYAQLLSPE